MLDVNQNTVLGSTRVKLLQNMQLEAVSAERDGLYEELLNQQASKRTVDKHLGSEKAKSARLEAELAIYRAQRLRPLPDQDQARLNSIKPDPQGLHQCCGASMAGCSGRG